MTGRVLGCAVALCLAAGASAGDGIGQWRNFTSMKNATDVSANATEIVASTSGGLFRWNLSDGSFQQFTSAEGLQSIDLTAVGIDAGANVWSGTGGGLLHVLTPQQSILVIRDITVAPQTNKRINELVMSGDTVLICTDFGLSIFRTSRFEFGDTYTRFGTIPPNVRLAVLSAATFQGSLWAALTDGQTIHRIARASLSLPNLLPPESWTLESAGPPGAVPRALAIFNNTLYCGTSLGLYRYDGAAWSAVGVLSGVPLTDIAASPAGLAVITAAGQVFSLDAQEAMTQVSGPLQYPATAVAFGPDGLPIVASTGGGVLRAAPPVWTPTLPEGPAGNSFVGLVVDQAGALWGGSGTANANGFFRFDGNGWTTFTARPGGQPTNDYYRMSADIDGSVWASSWGGGVARVTPGADTVAATEVYGANVGMVGIPANPAFIVCSNVVIDGQGNRWTSVLRPLNNRTLAVRKADGTWVTIPALLGGTNLLQLNSDGALPVDRALAVDAFDNLWAVVGDPSVRGAISFGNRGSIDSTASFHLSTDDGLPSDDVQTIIVDRENDVWIGTGRGIAIVLDPSNPQRAGGIASYKPLNGQTINSIAVDALNQKWVGTNEGAILLSSDGTQVLASYTTENTAGRLMDNRVLSVAVDPRNGTVYFGTPIGLASLTTSAAEPVSSFGELTVYPNPFLIPSASPATVDGLVEGSRLRILSVDGRVVADLATPGAGSVSGTGRTRWAKTSPRACISSSGIRKTGSRWEPARSPSCDIDYLNQEHAPHITTHHPTFNTYPQLGRRPQTLETGDTNNGYKDEIFTKRVRAGKRTYFFDVKSTKSEKDFYITITESKRVGETDYEKHKLFLYKEDFEKFRDALAETVEYVQTNLLVHVEVEERSPTA
jgi:ligand-binding sensor domain-containing protein